MLRRVQRFIVFACAGVLLAVAWHGTARADGVSGAGSASVTTGAPSDQPAPAGSPLGAGGSDDSAGPGIEADDFTGATTYSVPLPLPPGRANLAPRLVLNYHSYRRNPNSWVGYGWELDLGQIRRTAAPDTGSIEYTTGINFEVHFAGKTEELVLLKSGATPAEYALQDVLSPEFTLDAYAAKIDESYTLYFHVRNPSSMSPDMGWLVIDKGGRRYRFGVSSTALDETFSSTGEHWIARWLLEKITDPNNNTITIAYADNHLPTTIDYSDIRVVFSTSANVRYYPVFKQTFLDHTQVARLKTITVQQLTKENSTTLQEYQLQSVVSNY